MIEAYRPFSGIGGFAIAVQAVWGEEYKTVCFCDNNAFAQAVLRRHFPETIIYSDIRELTSDKLIADTENRRCKSQDKEVCARRNASISCDLLTGGFPCQPFSQAGKRRGTADNRYLWPEMLRVIQDFKPAWVIAENVRGLITMQQGMVFENICLDLEKSGYEVQAFIIPAVAINAPHRRDRVWIIAHTTSERCDNRSNNRQERYVQADIRIAEENKPKRNGWKCGIKQNNSDASNTCGTRLERRFAGNGLGLLGQCNRDRSDEKTSWNENWIEAATRPCSLDDGLSGKLVRLPDGTTISRSKWRQEALKAAGNAIVPQAAIEITQAIKDAEKVN